MTQPVTPSLPTVKPAATVVIFRQPVPDRPPEVLMVQRSLAMRFAGGAAVFPGGRIDPADRDLAERLAWRDADGAPGPDLAADELAARIAAIRETLEETGLVIGIDRPVSASQAAAARTMLLTEGALAPVLARFGWQIVPQVLVPFARWCPMREGSFDTRFYLADVGTGAVDIAVDQTENTHLFWASAIDVLAMADAGEISVIFPTRCNLVRLALYDSFAAACAAAHLHPVQMITPWQVAEHGQRWLTIPEGIGYPMTRQNMNTVLQGEQPGR